MSFRVDLHIHSCLSPCGSLEMSPRRIASEAVNHGLDGIALCDHNSTRNLPAFFEACRERNIRPYGGMEVTTREEVHCLTIFPTQEAAAQMGEEIYNRLPPMPHRPEVLGDQVWVNIDEEIEGEIPLYLGNAANISIEDTAGLCHSLGGLFIPAHIDRAYCGIISQLGFLPDMPYDALEALEYPPAFSTRGIPVVQNSDAHFPEDIGRRYFTLPGDIPEWEQFCALIKEGRIKLQ